ncbi:hypothetical protein Ancab_039607 [Ancistrocladus abbreviatus]
MAGAVVSSAANWIGTQLISEVKFLLDVQDQVHTLQQELKYIALHLKDADSGEEGDDDQVRLFTEEIRAIAFRAEDTVDNYILKVASSSSTNIGGNFLRKFPCFLCSSPDIHSIGKETKAIRNNTRQAVERLQQFRNTRFIASGEASNQPWPRQNTMRTYPHIEDKYVVGLDEDIKDLVQRLTRCMETRVMAIVGAGGTGKTTLAREIHNDIRIASHFKAKAWVTISQKWNKRDLLYEILRETRGINEEERTSIKNWSERELVEAIYGFSSEKQYLLVLDDMWEREAWDCIYPAVAHEGSGSKIVITTRKEDLPLQVDMACIIHRPRLLTEEQSWELFKKIALEGRDTQSIAADDVRMGREMAQKCHGLPLGVVTLAGLLRTNDTSEWEDVSSRFNSLLLSVEGPPQHGRSIYHTFEELKSIRTLQELEIFCMPRTFCHRLFKQGDQTSYKYQAGVANDRGGERSEDFHIIQHILLVRFTIMELKEK